jgi:Trypsin-like peptidase domain
MAKIGNRAKRAVLSVGNEGGRGFVVELDHTRVVVTAAHCLPELPVAQSSSFGEHTYFNLLAPLGGKPTVTTECWFVDPVSDLAVLGPPDYEILSAQHGAYVELMKSAVALSIAPVLGKPESESPGWLLSLKGKWIRCGVTHNGGPLYVTDAKEGIIGGMSGSPILDDDGSAIGVLTNSGGSGEVHTESGPNPRLIYHLPLWLCCEARAEASPVIAAAGSAGTD